MDWNSILILLSGNFNFGGLFFFNLFFPCFYSLNSYKMYFQGQNVLTAFDILIKYILITLYMFMSSEVRYIYMYVFLCIPS